MTGAQESCPTTPRDHAGEALPTADHGKADASKRIDEVKEKLSLD